MSNKIEIVEHRKNGWIVYVPAAQTVSLLTFLRDKTVFSIDIDGISGGQPMSETDIFTIDNDEAAVLKLVSDFKKQQN